MDKKFYGTLYCVCDYSTMPLSKVKHVGRRQNMDRIFWTWTYGLFCQDNFDYIGRIIQNTNTYLCFYWELNGYNVTTEGRVQEMQCHHNERFEHSKLNNIREFGPSQKCCSSIEFQRYVFPRGKVMIAVQFKFTALILCLYIKYIKRNLLRRIYLCSLTTWSRLKGISNNVI